MRATTLGIKTRALKFEPMRSPRSGKPVANQMVLHLANGECFVSYGQKIAIKTWSGEVMLDEHYWDYSRTTSKYRNEFLNEGIAETRKKIKSGEYKLGNLNN